MKRLFKLGVSLAVWGWDKARATVSKLVGSPRPPACVVLYYHAIPKETRGLFARQMDALLRHAEPIDAASHAPLIAGKRYAAVTFDDGFISVVQNALPELESRRIPATLFVPTGSLGRSPAWVKNPNAPARRETVLTADELKVLSGSRVMAIGSHTVNHPNLLKLEPAQARQELAECKATLEGIIGKEVPLFSFPHGKHNPQLVQQAKELGYRRVFTISPELALASPDEFVTGRTLTDPTDWQLEFTLKVLGAYRWLPALSSLKRRWTAGQQPAKTNIV